MIALTKKAVKTALGIRSDADLARFFSTTRQSVCKWRDDEPIPVQRQWQLRAMRPALFRPRRKADPQGNIEQGRRDVEEFIAAARPPRA